VTRLDGNTRHNPPNIIQLLERCRRRTSESLATQAISPSIGHALGPPRPATEMDLPEPVDRRWRLLAIVAAVMIPAGIALALWLARTAPASFEQLTFRRARIGGARFVSGGAAVVYSEASQGDALEVSRLDFADSPLSHRLNYPVRSDVLAARSGELALSLNRRFVIGERFARNAGDRAARRAARRARPTRTSKRQTGMLAAVQLGRRSRERRTDAERDQVPVGHALT
jgi:hypothetical protein